MPRKRRRGRTRAGQNHADPPSRRCTTCCPRVRLPGPTISELRVQRTLRNPPIEKLKCLVIVRFVRRWPHGFACIGTLILFAFRLVGRREPAVDNQEEMNIFSFFQYSEIKTTCADARTDAANARKCAALRMLNIRYTITEEESNTHIQIIEMTRLGLILLGSSSNGEFGLASLLDGWSADDAIKR